MGRQTPVGSTIAGGPRARGHNDLIGREELIVDDHAGGTPALSGKDRFGAEPDVDARAVRERRVSTRRCRRRDRIADVEATRGHSGRDRRL
jgi:hypothetical protein